MFSWILGPLVLNLGSRGYEHMCPEPQYRQWEPCNAFKENYMMKLCTGNAEVRNGRHSKNHLCLGHWRYWRNRNHRHGTRSQETEGGNQVPDMIPASLPTIKWVWSPKLILGSQKPHLLLLSPDNEVKRYPTMIGALFARYVWGGRVFRNPHLNSQQGPALRFPTYVFQKQILKEQL